MGILTGKTAVVSGGTRGIGLAIAKHLQQAGAKILITGRGAQYDGNFDYYSVDFSKQIATEEFAQYLQQLRPDILINNAGINIVATFTEIQFSDFAKIQQVNVLAPFVLTQAVIPAMKEKAWGRIVSISSIWSKISKPGRAAYSASKFALDGMTAALAAEVAEFGILANCVAPGFIETDLTRQTLEEEGIKAVSAQVPIKRLGQPEEIAQLVTWLASPYNTFISGQNIVADGGFSRV